MVLRNIIAILSFALIARSVDDSTCNQDNFLSTFYIVSDLTGSATGPALPNGGPPVLCTTAGSWISIPGASWIWDAVSVVEGGNNEQVIFDKTFYIPGAPVSGSLSIAVDNSGTVSLNGVATSCSPVTFTTVLTCDVSSYLVSGLNSLKIIVVNSGTGSSNNPAGLLYKLTVTTMV